MADFVLNFSNNFTSLQQEAAYLAASEYTKFLKDDITVNLFFTNTDKFSVNVAAGAFPNTIGGINYSDPSLDWSNSQQYNWGGFHDSVMNQAKDNNTVLFSEFKQALLDDRTTSQDFVAVDNLYSDIKNDGWGEYVNYRDAIRGISQTKGFELTNANAKALGIERDFGLSDGIIAENALDRFTSNVNLDPFVFEYRANETINSDTEKGTLTLTNVSGKDYNQQFSGWFSLKQAEIMSDEQGNLLIDGDLDIYRVDNYGSDIVYNYRTTDSTFLNSESNQITFTAKKLFDGGKFEPHAVNLYNVDGNNVYARPYSEDNPYVESTEALKALYMHEIGHVLGVISTVEDIPVEYGNYLVDSYDINDLPEEVKNFQIAQSYDLTPFDLFRYSDKTSEGIIERSLNPDVHGNGVHFSIDGVNKIASLSEGKHISKDYLIEVFNMDEGTYVNPYLDSLTGGDLYQASHWKEDTGLYGAVHDHDHDSHDTLSDEDMMVLDVIGYDVDYSGQSQGVVTTSTWSEAEIPDVSKAVYRMRRGFNTYSYFLNAENGMQVESEGSSEGFTDSFVADFDYF